MFEFKEGLYSCCSDIPVCLAGATVIGICILQGQAVSKATGQGCCVPCLIVTFGCFIGGAVNRRRIRKIYDISGSFLLDLFIWWRSGACAACQEYREVKIRSAS